MKVAHVAIYRSFISVQRELFTRFAIDELKRRIPIFKKEIYTDGSSWKANP